MNSCKFDELNYPEVCFLYWDQVELNGQYINIMWDFYRNSNAIHVLFQTMMSIERYFSQKNKLSKT